jgi:hypothetical protein
MWHSSKVTTVTDQNLIQEEIKRRLISGNANIRSRPFVLYGCETLYEYLTLKEEHSLRVFENGVEKNIRTEER